MEDRVHIKNDITRSYVCWNHMLQRCYSEKYHLKKPTYIGCTVCNEWLYYSNFKKWYDANYREGFHLDKDILVEGNKVYSPDTCRFVPVNINSILVDSGRARGDLPLGVTKRETLLRSGNSTITYQAWCCDGYRKRLTRTFKTIEEAVAWYSSTKTRIVREMATRALEAGDIQQDVFDALVARKF